MSLDPGQQRCGNCVSFRNDRAYLEAAMPGLTSMSSGDASVRADDGICLRHDRYLSAWASCADFIPVDRLAGGKAAASRQGAAEE
jgi:hypothetical protein